MKENPSDLLTSFEFVKITKLKASKKPIKIL